MATSNNPQQNIAIAEQYFSALETGDMALLASLFANDVVWHQPGNNPFSGDKNGFNEIGEMVGGMMQISTGTLKIVPDGKIMANGNMINAPLRFSATKGQHQIAMKGVDLFRIKDGKIAEVWLFSEDQHLEDMFWTN